MFYAQIYVTILYLLCHVPRYLCQITDFTNTIQIADITAVPLPTASADLTTNGLNVLLLSTPDDGSAFNFMLSGSLFASILEVNSQAPAGSDTGNVSAIEGILANGYSNAVQKKFLVVAGIVAAAFRIAAAVAALAVALASVDKFSHSHWGSSPEPIGMNLYQYDIDELDSLPSTLAVYKVAYESTVFVVTVPNTANFDAATATQAQGATTTGSCPVDDQETAIACCDTGCAASSTQTLCPTVAPKFPYCTCAPCLSAMLDLPGNAAMLAEGFNGLASMGAMTAPATTTPTPVCSASALWFNTTSTQCNCASAISATATAQYSTIAGALGQSACAFTASSDLGPPIPEPTNMVLLTCYNQTGPKTDPDNFCMGEGVSYSYVNLVDNTDCLPAPGCNCINVVSFNISTVTWNRSGCKHGKSVWQANQNQTCATWVNGNTSTPGTESIGFWPNCPGVNFD